MPARSAYPILPPIDTQGYTAQGYPYPEGGMTLREYYAGQALASGTAMLAASVNPVTTEEAHTLIRRRAYWAVKQADALIAALADIAEP